MKKNINLLILLLLVFGVDVFASTVNENSMVEFKANTTAKAVDVNANFKALKEAINNSDAELKTNYYSISDANARFANAADLQLGNNYISNATLEAGMMGWKTVEQASGGAFELVEAPDAPAGDRAIQNPVNTVVWGSSTTWITINRDKAYYVSGTFKRIGTGSAGTVFLAVRLRRSDGTEISGDGAWWFYPVNDLETPVDQWTHFRSEFGSGTKRPFPGDARYATIGFILNYEVGNTPGTRTYQVQGLGIHDAVDNHCVGNMVSYGGGCISPVQQATSFYIAQDRCKESYKGTVCMYNELQRACAAGSITTIPANTWMGDHGLAPGGNSDDEFFVTNASSCGSNIDGVPAAQDSANRSYLCCR